MARSKKQAGEKTERGPTPPPAAEAWQKQAAEAFKALGDPTRLRIFDVLRQATASEQEAGMTVGQVLDRLMAGGGLTLKDPSTISHHLKELRQVGLITVERDGQHRLCRINQPTLTALATYLCQTPVGIPSE